jgi:hypothetical protein
VKAFPPGHYYSPLPDLRDIRNNTGKTGIRKELGGIPQNLDDQLSLLADLGKHTNNAHYYNQNGESRYSHPNGYYPFGDALLLHGILKKYRPARIIEIGSGFSTAAMLDANQQYFAHQIKLTVVDPFPERLLKLCSREDLDRIEVIKMPVQHVDPSLFQALSANDLLFIDSSHVSKFNSDLNFILFEVLPILSKGVIIHFHDIYWPFEYPLELYVKGIAWNEAYLLRAFLQFNGSFSILLFPQFLMMNAYEQVKQQFPSLLEHGSVSLWVQKTSAK